MLDYKEYTIDGNGYQGNGNGYHSLNGDWALYYKVARGFKRRVKPEDREDFLHDLFLVFARVKAKYNSINKELTEAGLIRVASYEVAAYWRKLFRRINGIDCGSCSKAQRRKCRKDWLYSECPKAIKLEYLSKPMVDSEGNITELGELIADDTVDLEAWLEASTWELGYPKRLVEIAHKLDNEALSAKDRMYLSRYRRQAQKSLF